MRMLFVETHRTMSIGRPPATSHSKATELEVKDWVHRTNPDLIIRSSAGSDWDTTRALLKRLECPGFREWANKVLSHVALSKLSRGRVAIRRLITKGVRLDMAMRYIYAYLYKCKVPSERPVEWKERQLFFLTSLYQISECRNFIQRTLLCADAPLRCDFSIDQLIKSPSVAALNVDVEELLNLLYLIESAANRVLEITRVIRDLQTPLRQRRSGLPLVIYSRQLTGDVWWVEAADLLVVGNEIFATLYQCGLGDDPAFHDRCRMSNRLILEGGAAYAVGARRRDPEPGSGIKRLVMALESCLQQYR
jgi:hypothetical protein